MNDKILSGCFRVFLNNHIVLILLFTVLYLFSSCRQEPVFTEGHAVVYGISDYGVSGANLTYCHTDANSVSAMLAAANWNVHTQTDGAATKATLLSDLQWVETNATADTPFFFYYSGHGGQSVAAPDSEGYGKDEYNEWLFLRDSITGPGTVNLSLAVYDDELRELIADIPSRHKTVVIDACNSGGFIGDGAEIDGIPPNLYYGWEGFSALEAAFRMYVNFPSSEDLNPRDAVVMSAAGEQEFSYESSTLGHGVFTYFFLESGTRGDENHDGWITISESYNYTKRELDRYWNDQYAAEYEFLPHISGGPVDYVLLQAP